MSNNINNISTKFFYYSKSSDKYPGKGANEFILESNIHEYKELSKIKDWRKILSNFYESKFVFNNLTYNTAEHAYQSQKIAIADKDKAYLFAMESNSKLSKSDGNEARKNRKMAVLDNKQLMIWNETMNKVLEDILYSKFSQVEAAKEVLLLTKDAELWHGTRGIKNSRQYTLEKVRSRLFSTNTTLVVENIEEVKENNSLDENLRSNRVIIKYNTTTTLGEEGNRSNKYIIDINNIDSEYIKNIYSISESDDSSVIELELYEHTLKCIIRQDLNELIQHLDIKRYLSIKNQLDTSIVRKENYQYKKLEGILTKLKLEIEDVFDQLNYFGSNVLYNKFLEYVKQQIQENQKKENQKELEEFFEYIIEEYKPDKRINKKDDFIFYMSSNTRISEQFFEKYITSFEESKLNWQWLSANTSISENFFEKYLDRIDWSILSGNTNMSEQFFEKHLKEVNWDELSENSSLKISEEFFEKHYINENRKNMLEGIYLNANLSEQFFEKFISSPDYKENVDWACLSGNTSPKISEQFFEKYIDKVEWYSLSGNTSLSESFFEKHIDKVVWSCLSENTNLGESFFEKYLDNISWLNLSANKSSKISEQFFKKYLKNINLDWLCLNNNLSEQFFENIIQEEYKLDWNRLCCNNNLSEQFFEKYIIQNSNKDNVFWTSLPLNDNMSISFLKKHISSYYLNNGLIGLATNNFEKYFKRKNKSQSYFKFDKQLKEISNLNSINN